MSEMKITTWNVNGWRAALRKGALAHVAELQRAAMLERRLPRAEVAAEHRLMGASVLGRSGALRGLGV